MQTRISGTTMPVLEVGLDPGEVVVSETGQMAWMTASMQMSTTMGAGTSGGLWGVVKRAVAGGGLFMTEFSPAGPPGRGGVRGQGSRHDPAAGGAARRRLPGASPRLPVRHPGRRA